MSDRDSGGRRVRLFKLICYQARLAFVFASARPIREAFLPGTMHTSAYGYRSVRRNHIFFEEV